MNLRSIENATQPKEQTSSCCSDGCNAGIMEKVEAPTNIHLKIKVLGSGCAKCKALEAATMEALAALNIDAAVDHVTDFSQIAAYGVMSMPALVIDDKVVSFGKELKKKDIMKLLSKNRQ